MAHACPTPTSRGTKWIPTEIAWLCRCGQRWRWMGWLPLNGRKELWVHDESPSWQVQQP